MLGIREDMRDFIMSHTGQEIPLAIISTVEAIWAESKRPQLHSKRKTNDGWEFVFTLPPGMTFRQFANQEEAFRDAIGDVTTEMLHKDRFSILNIITRRIGKRYEYDWNYQPDKKMYLPIPIGYTHNGLYVEDLATIPHVLVAGVTRSGKSNFLHTVVNSLLQLDFPPKVVIIDLKTLEYTYLENKVLLVTQKLDACMALIRLLIEMRNRIEILKAARCVNIFKYNEKYEPMPHVVVIVDELAELDDERAQKDFETIAALSAAAGFCIVAATQRPDKETFKHFGRTKGQLLGRLCFRMVDAVNSRIVLDSDAATKLPKIKGRAIWRLDEQIEVQVPYLDPEIAEEFLNEQPQKMFGARRTDSIDNYGMGSDVNRSNLPTIISVIRGLSKKIIKIDGKETD